MSKKDICIADAERMYVIEQMTINEIASKLELGEKTVRNWKSDENWDSKRKAFLKNKQAFHEELYDFARELMAAIKRDLANGERVDTGRMYAFLRMLPSIIKVKEYEDIADAKQTDEAKKGLTPEVIREIEEKVLGIKRKKYLKNIFLEK